MYTKINILDTLAQAYSCFLRRTLKYSIVPFALFFCLFLSFFVTSAILWPFLFLKVFLSYIFLHAVLAQEVMQVSYRERSLIFKKNTLSIIKWQLIVKYSITLVAVGVSLQLLWDFVFLENLLPGPGPIKIFFFVLISSCLGLATLLFSSIKTFPFFIDLALGKKAEFKKSYQLSKGNFCAISSIYLLITLPVISVFSFLIVIYQSFFITKLDLSLAALHFKVMPFALSMDKIPLIVVMTLLAALLTSLISLLSLAQILIYEALTELRAKGHFKEESMYVETYAA